MAVCYRVGTALAKACFSTFANWEVEGKEAVPPKGPLIVVCNHVSNADAPMVVASVPRRAHFMAKGSLFRNFMAAHLLRAVGVHPLNRNGLDIEALRWNLQLLSRDQCVVLFPEGTRSPTGGMKRGHPGVAFLATKTQAPILPVAITGTENIPSYWRMPLPLCRMKVRIGEPFSLPVIEGTLRRPVLQHLTDMIMQRIASLLPDEYRGYYATREGTDTG